MNWVCPVTFLYYFLQVVAAGNAARTGYAENVLWIFLLSVESAICLELEKSNLM